MRALGLSHAIDMPIGSRFGRLTVLELFDGHRARERAYRCRCDCGSETIATGSTLRRGDKRSCGCLFREMLAERNRESAKQEKITDHPLYYIWVGMRARCRDTQNPNYGGRGIRVCDRWDSSFQDFVEDIGERPGPSYSLDRVDVDGNYEPANVRWATKHQQAQNRRSRPKSKTVAIAIPYDDYAELLEIARREAMSVSAVGRRAVASWLRRL